ncbi:MAG: rhomboid family intramembrane serine protease [Pegethrix bostrychoides GSE-TBD4-15B]|jgi:membrane associated rhomboid family serine protease|uniref:Rhomboid family intramembrane serine protease n=1 Tax=Pegethrix bostrychoides GSE-TBD4-15B TaxID=2839662 RepID=A0A951PDQ6_9CYAN|nr:rhomboid family intramembrane serine protease [Pegethrix bostrychoides GSE-TBD4-15B]
MNRSDEAKGLVGEVRAQIGILVGFVGLMWAIEILDLFLGGALDQFGIRPRSIVGLRGILFAPFLHGSLLHLMANTVPFVILGWLVMLRRTRDFWPVTIIVTLVAGLGTWLFAPPWTVHIGASGLVFGYLGFLLSRGYFERSFGSIAMSLLVGLLYGGMIWGVLPGQIGISWQGHLFGFLGGILAAQMLAEPRRRAS